MNYGLLFFCRHEYFLYICDLVLFTLFFISNKKYINTKKRGVTWVYRKYTSGTKYNQFCLPWFNELTCTYSKFNLVWKAGPSYLFCLSFGLEPWRIKANFSKRIMVRDFRWKCLISLAKCEWCILNIEQESFWMVNQTSSRLWISFWRNKYVHVKVEVLRKWKIAQLTSHLGLLECLLK